MNKYLVEIFHNLVYSIELDANSAEEAKSLAMNMHDKGELDRFDTTYDEFDFVQVEEVEK